MRKTLALSLALSSAPLGALADVSMGQRAADFDLPSLGGKRLKLSSLRGKVVVVDFWASWCGPCKEELPELEKLKGSYGERVVFVAINLDNDRGNAQRMANSLHLSLTVPLDPEKTVANRYNPPKMPTSYVVDKAGFVRYVNAGFDGASDVAKLRKQLDELTAK